MVFARSALRAARPASSLLSQRATTSFAHRGASLSKTASLGGIRTLTATSRQHVKFLLVLYYVSIHLSQASRACLKQLANTFQQGHEHAKQEPRLLGTTENELGLRKWIEDQGHTLVTTSDKEGENSKFDQELVDAEVIITTP